MPATGGTSTDITHIRTHCCWECDTRTSQDSQNGVQTDSKPYAPGACAESTTDIRLLPMPEEMAVEGLAEAWLRSVCSETAKLFKRAIG
jgi:hypothetical protein